MQEKKRRPDRRVYVCMYVGKATRAPRRGVLCIYVLQEPRDGTARHTEGTTMYVCMHVCMYIPQWVLQEGEQMQMEPRC